MAAKISTGVVYSNSGNTFWEPSEVDRLTVYKKNEEVIRCEFYDKQKLRSWLEIPATNAKVLARLLRMVADGDTTHLEANLS